MDFAVVRGRLVGSPYYRIRGGQVEVFYLPPSGIELELSRRINYERPERALPGKEDEHFAAWTIPGDGEGAVSRCRWETDHQPSGHGRQGEAASASEPGRPINTPVNIDAMVVGRSVTGPPDVVGDSLTDWPRCRPVPTADRMTNGVR